jgi:hypothetical protein
MWLFACSSDNTSSEDTAQRTTDAGKAMDAGDSQDKLSKDASKSDAEPGKEMRDAGSGDKPRDAGGGDKARDAMIEYADASRLPPGDGNGNKAGGPAPSQPSKDAGGGNMSSMRSDHSQCMCDEPVSADEILNNPLACPTPDSASGCKHTDTTWTHDESCDQCTRAYCEISGSAVGYPFPPCCDLTGKATAGPASGTPLYALCQDVFDCSIAEVTKIAKTGDLAKSSLNGMLYCGSAETSDCTSADSGKGPKGPCAKPIDAAFQGLPTMTVLSHFTDFSQGKVYSAGSEVLSLVNCMLSNCAAQCFSATSASNNQAQSAADSDAGVPVCQ